MSTELGFRLGTDQPKQAVSHLAAEPRTHANCQK